MESYQKRGPSNADEYPRTHQCTSESSSNEMTTRKAREDHLKRHGQDGYRLPACSLASQKHLFCLSHAPVPIGLDEGEVRQQAIVRATPDRQGVVPAVGIEHVQHAAKADRLRGAKAQLDGDALRSRTKLQKVLWLQQGGGGGSTL